jgi:hypothetical protein
VNAELRRKKNRGKIMDEKITQPNTLVSTSTHSLEMKNTKNTEVYPKKFAQINNRLTDLRCHDFSNNLHQPALTVSQISQLFIKTQVLSEIRTDSQISHSVLTRVHPNLSTRVNGITQGHKSLTRFHSRSP